MRSQIGFKRAEGPKGMIAGGAVWSVLEVSEILLWDILWRAAGWIWTDGSYYVRLRSP